MSTSTYEATSNRMREMFALNGLPEVIASDNATCFKNEEFENFMKRNGILNLYHPTSNGLAERSMLTVKEDLGKKFGNHLQTKLRRLTFGYCRRECTIDCFREKYTVYVKKICSRCKLFYWWDC